jgi:UDP-N-acetylmuramoyl-tripeptide--D-alanyl-D-alanine ligase
VIVNADDPLAAAATEGLEARVVPVGAGGEVRLVEAELRWPDGLAVTVDVHGERVSATVALHGLHFAPLVALAFAAAHACGVPAAVAARGAQELFRQAPQRLQLVDGPDGSVFLLDDAKCRLHTALAGIHALAAVPRERRIVVLGELQEKPFTTEVYEPLVAPLAETADVVLAIGRSATPLAELLGDRVRPVSGVDELADRLRELAAPGVAFLTAAATAQHLERAQLLLRGADVGCLVARCTLRWSCESCPHLVPGPPERVIEAPAQGWSASHTRAPSRS